MKRIGEIAGTQAERDLTEKTKVFLAWAQKVLKGAGFVRTDARTFSAMFEWTFRRDQRIITLSGWHGVGKKGTCRWYGDLKLCFELGDNQTLARYLPYAREKIRANTSGTVEEAENAMAMMKDFISKL